MTPDRCEYLLPDEVVARLDRGEDVMSATFVTPYPPGFPVLVPGQCFSGEIMEFMSSLDTPEVHGYRPELGYRVFLTSSLIAEGGSRRSAGSHSCSPRLDPLDPTRPDWATGGVAVAGVIYSGLATESGHQ